MPEENGKTEDLTPQEIEDKEEKEYEKLFREASGVEPAPSADEDDDPSSVDGSDPDSPDDETPKPDGSKEDESSDEGRAEGEDSGKDDDPYAWIDGLPEEYRQAAEAMRHNLVSNEGRVSALQRRIDEYDRRLQDATASGKGRSKDTSSAAPTKKEEKEPSPKLKEFLEQYPQLAESVKELVATEAVSSQDVEKVVSEMIQPIMEERAAERRRTAKEEFEEGAAKIFDTARTGLHYSEVVESDLYKQFINEQPLDVKRLATTTSDPSTALWVLEQFALYAEDYADKEGLTGGSPSDNNSKPGKSEADKAARRRQANKDQSGTPAPRSAVTDPADDGSYDAWFEKFSSKKS